MDSSGAIADSMLDKHGPMTSKKKRWDGVVQEHRSHFTQVREIDLVKASIRLPEGKFFVTVTEQEHFDKIPETIPACVQTRLDEFLAGPGKQRGVKVYYLKPLCVEVGDDLILTTREDLMSAIDQIKEEVFAEYRWRYCARLPKALALGAVNTMLAFPRSIMQYSVLRQQKKIEAYHAQLEFERRKLALRTATAYCKSRTDGCSFDEVLALTSPLERSDVIGQFAVENELSKQKRDQLVRMAAGSIPWFVSLAVTVSYLSTLSLTFAPPVMLCDPAFVAEMPGARGTLLKIGHFDEVGGVMHVEI